MSWDVYVMKAPYASTVDLPEDFSPEPLGATAEVRGRLLAVLPEIDFSNPAWGQLEGPEWSIELNLGQEEPAPSLMLHVRGGDDVIAPIAAIAEALGAKAMDMSTGEFLAFEADATRGLRAWRAFRDQVMGGKG